MDVACILAREFEDAEYRICRDALCAEGVRLLVVGAREGQEILGRRHEESVRVVRGVSAARATEYAALLVPGGGSPDVLRADPRFVELVREFDRLGKPIGALCHGPQILLTADVVRGRRVTAWPTVQGDLRKAGAEVVDRPVVVDGNLVTARTTAAASALCAEVLTALGVGGREQVAPITVAESS